jgi:hypothetical protein
MTPPHFRLRTLESPWPVSGKLSSLADSSKQRLTVHFCLAHIRLALLLWRPLDATDAARGASDIVLQQEGLSTIVKAIYGSRKIFKRIETYLTYRICSSFIFGFVFVLIYCASEYNFPTWTLILMSLLNDFAVTSSSKDNVMIQKKPQTLNITRVATTAAVMAIISSVQVWGFVQSIIIYRGINGDHFWGLRPSDEEDGVFSGCDTAAFIFLVLIITLQLDLIAARSPKPFWRFSTAKDDQGYFTGVPPPSKYVLIAVSISLTIATFIAVYWSDDIVIGSGFGMEGMGWRNAGLVWAWCIVWFVFTDHAKAAVIALMDKAERDKAKGRTWQMFYRSILEQQWDPASIEAEKQHHMEELRGKLSTYDGSLRSNGSMRSSVSQAVSMGLAANLQSIREEEEALGPLTHQVRRIFISTTPCIEIVRGLTSIFPYITKQHELLAIESLQNDPALLRVISAMSHQIFELQHEVDELTKKMK